jgi:succinoglycan biosynthesis transport protein ExoP
MHFRDYISVLQRRKLLLVAAVVLVVGSALAVSFLQTPVYEARTRLLLEPNVSVFGQSTQGVVSRAPTEIQVIESAPVAAKVREALGQPVPGASAVQVGQTDVVEIRVQSGSPSQAAKVANAYGDAYIAYRRQQAIDSLLAAAGEVQKKMDAVTRDIADLDAHFVPDKSGAPTARPDRDALVAQRVLFKQKLDELQVDASVKNGAASVVTPAGVPSAPIRPRPLRSAVLATAVGLIIGGALAFFFDHLDDSIKTKQDLERAVPNVAVLGMIPPSAGWKVKADTKVVSSSEPRSPAAEAYRGLRTSIRFLGIDRSLRTIQVTSASASEGKSTTVANLGVALARAGARVVIVCCDLRRPRVHDFFGLPNDVGLTTVLLGEVPLVNAVQQVPGEERLFLLASGEPPPNPSELLSSPRCDKLIASLHGGFEFVLIDSPPVLPVTDAVVVSARVDGTLLIATAGASTINQVARAAELLRQVDATLIGTVLNNASSGDTGYGYGYGVYGASEPDVPAATNGDKPRRPSKRVPDPAAGVVKS